MTTLTASPIESWLGTGDVGRKLNVSREYVNRLVHQQKLIAVRTRLGWLVDPQSVTDFDAQRSAQVRKA